MAHVSHDAGVSRHIGSYSDAVEVAPGLRWLFTSGTPGVDQSGTLPADFAAQARLAWANVFEALSKARMSAADIVKVNTSVTDAAFIPDYVQIRKELLGDARPAFMLSVIDGMIKPGILVEIEVVAAAP